MEIRVEKLCKRFGDEVVLHNLSFTAGNGVTCIMAPSGAGKTTLLRILLGLETADSGRVTGLEHCRWGVVFQENRLLEQLDAMGNLRFALSAALEETAARELLHRLGLGDVGDKQVRDYSGGMKRRLALARALLAPADALALDEPFTGLDEESRKQVAACIGAAAAERPVLLVTHRREDAAALNARVLILPNPVAEENGA